MAEEDDTYDPNPKTAHMAAEILALRQLVEALIEEMPERALLHISKSLDSAVTTSRKIADDAKSGTDPACDFADRVFEVRADVLELCHMAAQNLADGARIRTVQPAKIDPKDVAPDDASWPA